MSSEEATDMGLNMKVEILGQQPDLQVCTQLSSVFRMQPDLQVEDVLAALRNGLVQFAKDFPWLAGQIIYERDDLNGSGCFKIRPFEPAPRLIVRDARHDGSMPFLDDMTAAGYPISMFDESKIAPRMAVPGGPRETADDPAPVLLLQVTLVPGALILTSATAHGAIDVVGQARYHHLT